MSAARRTRTARVPFGLAGRGLLPGLLGVWIVTLVAILAVAVEPDLVSRTAIILAGAGLLTAALSWIGWTVLVSPGRRLRIRGTALAFSGDRLSRLPVTSDEFHDLDRALSRIGERLARQEAQIQREQGMLRAMLESQGEPMLAVDSAGVVAMVNAPAERFLHVGAGSITGKPLRSYLTSTQLLIALDAAMEGRTTRLRVRIPTSDGERTWDCSSAPLPMPGGADPGALLILRDVTELADAVRVKTDFVANASHELRTPLAAIRGAVETLQSEAGAAPRVATRMQEIIAGHVHRLESLVQDLLDLSRVESGEAALRIEPLRLDLLRRAILDQFEDQCTARGVRIAFDIPDSLGGWSTDPRLIVLILRNLVENAAKFAHDNTEIRVVARMERAEHDIVRFEVRDKGIGIPLAQQQRVFERFYQVDPARPGYEQLSTIGRSKRGTGLGLAIVRHAVLALGGRVGIQSIYSQGTTVWFEVPYHLPSDLPQEPAPGAPEAPETHEEEDARFIDEPDPPATPEGGAEPASN